MRYYIKYINKINFILMFNKILGNKYISFNLPFIIVYVASAFVTCGILEYCTLSSSVIAVVLSTVSDSKKP